MNNPKENPIDIVIKVPRAWLEGLVARSGEISIDDIVNASIQDNQLRSRLIQLVGYVASAENLLKTKKDLP